MVIQVIIRLTLYIDQVIIRNGGKRYGTDSSRHGIDNTVRETKSPPMRHAWCALSWLYPCNTAMHTTQLAFGIIKLTKDKPVSVDMFCIIQHRVEQDLVIAVSGFEYVISRHFLVASKTSNVTNGY